MSAEVRRLDEAGPDPTEPWADGALTVGGAVEWTGASRSELYRAMRDGEVAWTTRGRRRLLARRSLVRWLAEGSRGASR